MEGVVNTAPILSEEFRLFLDARIEDDDDDELIVGALLEYSPNVENDDAITHLHIKKDDEGRVRVTYTTPGRMKKTDRGPFDVGGHRVTARPASVVQRITGRNNGRELDCFVNRLTSFFIPPPNIELWPGDRIYEAYRSSNNCKCGSRTSLHSSCRVNATKTELAFHTANGEIAVILCGSCGLVESRTLVWTDSDTGKKALDRTFGPEGHIPHLNNWIVAQGGFRRNDLRDDYGMARGGVCFNVVAKDHEVRRHGYLPAYDTMRGICDKHNVFGLGPCRRCEA